MEQTPRHQCCIYDGSPARYLPAIAAAIIQKLGQNCRCLYLNSPAMVAGLRSYLSASGVDVAAEIDKGRLILTSDQPHLVDGRFDTDRMMALLHVALEQALKDGYKGLWATGDIAWEFGSEKDLAKLLLYEWKLEEFFQKHPELSGVCQYHTDMLPPEIMRQGLLAHPSIFMNETLSKINPHYLDPKAFKDQEVHNPVLDEIIKQLCALAPQPA